MLLKMFVRKRDFLCDTEAMLVTERDSEGPSEETYMEDGALARVQHPQGLVLAGGENPGAVTVPAGAVDEVGVHAVDPHHRVATSHVPQDHHVIAAFTDTMVTSVKKKKSLKSLIKGS